MRMILFVLYLIPQFCKFLLPQICVADFLGDND